MEDDEYKALQVALLLRPEQGAIISKPGGLRQDDLTPDQLRILSQLVKEELK